MNVKALQLTMSMEDMPLSQSDKERIQECIDGKVSFQEAITLLIQKHTHKQAV
jgi:hypothetical protein